MPFLQKITTVRYFVGTGKNAKRCQKNTPGAKPQTEMSKKWYGVWKDGGKTVKLPLCEDKRAAQAMLTDLDRQHQRDRAGLTDKHKADKCRGMTDWIEEYVADMEFRSLAPDYIADTKNTLDRASRLCGFKILGDCSGDKLDDFIRTLTCSPRRKNTYRLTLVTFCDWLIKKGKLEKNPFTNCTISAVQPMHRRRALSVEDLEDLLTAAYERPVLDAKKVPHGKNKGQPIRRLSQAFQERREREGRERYLTYKTAVLTGLRRGELTAVKVEHVLFGNDPKIHLPGQFTKNGKDAVQPIKPDHAAELQKWISDTKKTPQDKLFRIAAPSVAIANLRRDLIAAGIPYELNGKVFDYHSFRVCTSTYLTAAKIHERIRLLFMRHADRHLTDHYDDAEFHSLREAVSALPSLTYQTPQERAAEHQRITEVLDMMTEAGRECMNDLPEVYKLLDLS